MNKNIISIEDARDLLDKIFSERIQVLAFFSSAAGIQSRVTGYIDSITTEGGLVISVGRPPATGPAFLSVPITEHDLEFSYCDKRELPEPMRELLAAKYGDSVFLMRFVDSEDLLALLFTM